MEMALIGLVAAIVFLIGKIGTLKTIIDETCKKIDALERLLNTLRDSNFSNEVLLHTLDAKVTVVMSERNSSHPLIATNESSLMTHEFKDYTSTTALVTKYDFNFKHFESDLTCWCEIKKNMSKEEIVAIIGNPRNVDVESENHDDISQTWYFYDKERNQAVIRFDHMNRVNIFQMQSQEEVEDAAEKVKKEYGI